MRFGVFLDKIFTQHTTPPGHPERSERISALLKAFQDLDGILQFPPVRSQEEWILSVHTERHYRQIKETTGTHQALDPDTHTSPESFHVAMMAVGSAVRLVQLLNEGEIESGFLLARPPGHHAESDKAMGFCLFNSVAVAAQWALDQKLAERVAIVDFDVHHGNGTQEIFYRTPDVLYISSHQYPFYPGTGTFQQVGQDDGTGFTLNLPLQAGRGDYFYTTLYEEVVCAVLEEYSPDLILVSAGYDLHIADSLAGMNVSTEGFGQLTFLLNSVAGRVCDGRILYCLEGGYNIRALTESVLCTIYTSITPQEYSFDPQDVEAYASYKKQLVTAVGQYWDSLR